MQEMCKEPSNKQNSSYESIKETSIQWTNACNNGCKDSLQLMLDLMQRANTW
jgi:hypothetical protein